MPVRSPPEWPPRPAAGPTEAAADVANARGERPPPGEGARRAATRPQPAAALSARRAGIMKMNPGGGGKTPAAEEESKTRSFGEGV